MAKKLFYSFGQLTEVVKTGKSALNTDDPEVAANYFPEIIKILYKPHTAAAVALAEYIVRETKYDQCDILDVACGSCAWSIPLAKANKKVSVVAQDLENVLKDITSKYIHDNNVSGQFKFLSGELDAVDFGENKYDLIILGHIIHSEGQKSSEQLLNKLYVALRKGGSIVIAEIFLDETRTGPRDSVMFDLNMLVNTKEGRVFTITEVEKIFRKVGIYKIAKIPMPNGRSPLIIGEK